MGVKETMKFIILVIIIMMMMVGESKGDEQYEALLEFFNATNGNNWKKNQFWYTNQDPCGIQKGNSPWQGLACSGPYVVEMHLSNNGLGGTIPSSLSHLSFLDTLDLSENMLVGTVPLSVTSMGTFQELNLGGNHLQGNLPEFSPNSSSLQYLDLNNNNFHGSIPLSYASLPGLSTLDISNNALSGTIPLAFVNSSISSLYVNFDGFVGQFPLALCQKLSICEALGNPNLLCPSMQCQCGYMGSCNCNNVCLYDSDCKGICPHCVNGSCQQQSN